MATEVTDDRALVPYAPDFTPSTLGKVLGEDRVLPWLLETIRDLQERRAIATEIAAKGLGHVGGQTDEKALRNRRDMASHVLGGLAGYRLTRETYDGQLALTEIGAAVLAASPVERDRLFARHIITSCNGHRLLDVIREYGLRGEEPSLEDLAEVLDRNLTAKSVSTMRAWLARAGVFGRSGYRIHEDVVSELLGSEAEKLLGITAVELEFVLAARAIEHESGSESVRASDAADLAETRRPDVRIPRKSLGSFVAGLIKREVAEHVENVSGKGGSARVLKLTARASNLADDELRSLLGQSKTAYNLRTLLPLAALRDKLNVGTAEERGWIGEMLAVHACLMLGLKVVAWRSRAPGAEIDLLAERVVGLSFQRWAIQVKNTDLDLDADRVDREIGASVGVGVTHILFIVPRASLTGAAEREITVRSRLTELHIYALTREVFDGEISGPRFTYSLKAQAERLARYKRDEALRREGVS